MMVAVVHAQRRVQLLVEVLVERHPRRDLGQRAECVEARVVVAVAGPGHDRGPHMAEARGFQLQGGRVRVFRGRLHVRLQEEGRDPESARVRQQVADADESGPVVVPRAHVLAHQVAMGQLPVLHEHGDARSHDRLGVRSHPEQGVGLHRDVPSPVPPTQRLVEHNLPVLGDQQHRTDQIPARDRLFVQRDARGKHPGRHAGFRRGRAGDNGALGGSWHRMGQNSDSRQGNDGKDSGGALGASWAVGCSHGTLPLLACTRYFSAKDPIQWDPA